MKLVQIIRLREEGTTYGQIADKVGISRQRVHQLLKRERPDLTGSRIHLAYPAIIRMRESGSSYEEISHKLKFSVQYLHRLIRSMRPDLPKTNLQDLGMASAPFEDEQWFVDLSMRYYPEPVRWHVRRYQDIKEMAETNFTLPEVAGVLGIKHYAAYASAKKYGVQFPDARRKRKKD